jgi:arsenate reductase
MMHGWLEHLSGDDVEVVSAGTVPKGVHPLSIEVMAEIGIDISAHSSEHVSTYLSEVFDTVITVCDDAKETCPVFPGAKRLVHRAFEDPDHPGLDPDALGRVFRRVRDEIGIWSEGFLAGMDKHSA